MIRGEVLLVDDDPLIRQSTEQWLTMSGFAVTCCSTAHEALSHLSMEFGGILVSDVMMPDIDGLELMAQAQARIPNLPVILITGHGDVDMAIKAVRDGAYDFIEKPFVPERLAEAVHRACEKRQLMLENVRLQQNLATQSGLDTRLIGISPSLQKLRSDLLKCAELDTNVIIYGETGTGKELVAQCLHEFSKRQKKPFVALNCGAIPESLIESELFGHESGAFTGATAKRIGKFEYADGGTLLLDEIESMPHHLQIKLLRTLQEGVIERLGSNQQIPVDLRIVAASKADLSIDDNFRQDLFYRLNVSTLYLPPLRERTEDIPLLFEHYARLAATQHSREPRRISGQDVRTIQQYRWPGNVRELKNIAVRYALDGEQSAAQLLYPQQGELTHERFVDTSLPLAVQVANFESAVIQHALMTHQGNIKAVMDMLDLPRRTLNQKMAKYDLNRSDFLSDAERETQSD
ncbi:sigma-54-dependent transcriptional regulator [Neptunomonas marina]|uniref:Sigma-54-dependent Fis family transcriptional regulator n=1 Tax=Neptunomonas marina TaxID=1815562 RepID=A0A437QAU4_9GAMM|nr:sigma-54 dependent transcriptional regulator [Neptunomonas marina]RVU31627.1 sigma-54-dependent Fis family transcriptional regulator [Neptunomonas marina]